MEYKVKRDFAPIFLMNLLFVCLFWAYSPFVRTLWLFVTLYAVTLVFYVIYLASVLYSTCKIEDGVLTFRSGMFVCKVNISKVVSAKKSINIFPSLSHSIDRVQIESENNGKRKVTYVAVKNNDDLLIFLQACILENQEKNNRIDVIRPAKSIETKPEIENQSAGESNQVVVIVPPTNNSNVAVEADVVEPAKQTSKEVETVVETTEQVIEIVKQQPEKTTKVAKTKTTKAKKKPADEKKSPADEKKKPADEKKKTAEEKSVSVKATKPRNVRKSRSKKVFAKSADVKIDLLSADNTKQVFEIGDVDVQSTDDIEKEVKKVARHRNTVRKDRIKAATAEELNEAIKNLVSDENNVQIKITTSKKRTTKTSPSSEDSFSSTTGTDQAN